MSRDELIFLLESSNQEHQHEAAALLRLQERAIKQALDIMEDMAFKKDHNHSPVSSVAYSRDTGRYLERVVEALRKAQA